MKIVINEPQTGEMLQFSMNPQKKLRELQRMAIEYVKRKTPPQKNYTIMVNLLYHGKLVWDNMNKTCEEFFGEEDVVYMQMTINHGKLNKHIRLIPISGSYFMVIPQ